MRTTLLLLFGCSLLIAGDWTTVAGNSEHNGRSEDQGSISNLYWEAWSPPSTLGMQVYTWAGRLVTMRYDFNTMTGTIVCHDLATGDTLWTRLYGPANSRILPIGFRDDRVYARNFRETGQDTLYCLSPEDGSILWQSRWTVERGIIWAANYTASGDLIVPGTGSRILCLNRETGDTVWTCYRPLPNTGAEWMCVHDTILYTWQGFINTPKKLLAVSTNTGRILDSTPELPGDGDQELPFSVGPDGTVFCQRDGGLLYALRYDDSGFVELWSRSSGGGTWMNFGADGTSLYAPSGRKLYRLQAETGAALDSSADLVTSGALVPRISIDRHGNLFVMATNGTGEGKLWELESDLDTVGHVDYPYCYYSGPALCSGDLTVIAAAGTTLRAYLHPVATEELARPAGSHPLLGACPNPFRTGTAITLEPPTASPRQVAIFDASGQKVRTLPPGRGSWFWDGCDDSGRKLSPGSYFGLVRNQLGPVGGGTILLVKAGTGVRGR